MHKEIEVSRELNITFDELKPFFDVKIDKKDKFHIKGNDLVINKLIDLRNINSHQASLMIRKDCSNEDIFSCVATADMDTKVNFLNFMKLTLSTLQALHEIS